MTYKRFLAYLILPTFILAIISFNIRDNRLASASNGDSILVASVSSELESSLGEVRELENAQTQETTPDEPTSPSEKPEKPPLPNLETVPEDFDENDGVEETSPSEETSSTEPTETEPPTETTEPPTEATEPPEETTPPSEGDEESERQEEVQPEPSEGKDEDGAEETEPKDETDSTEPTEETNPVEEVTLEKLDCLYNQGTGGRLVVIDANITCQLNTVDFNSDEAQHLAQYYTDEKDSAAIFKASNIYIISDHHTQSFANLHKVQPGTKAYIGIGTDIIELTCYKVCYGLSLSGVIVSDEYVSVVYYDGYLLYTYSDAEEDHNLLLTFWR